MKTLKKTVYYSCTDFEIGIIIFNHNSNHNKSIKKTGTGSERGDN